MQNPEPGELVQCHNTATTIGQVCGADLDPYGDHSLSWDFGPLTRRRHEDVADELAGECEEAGVHARREAYKAGHSHLLRFVQRKPHKERP